MSLLNQARARFFKTSAGIVERRLSRGVDMVGGSLEQRKTKFPIIHQKEVLVIRIFLRPLRVRPNSNSAPAF